MTTKAFNVAGLTFPRDGQTARGIDLVKYAVHGSEFILEREPHSDKHDDKNAILVKQRYKRTGHIVVLGYVPAKLAAELAPLMDKFNWQPVVKFGRKFINEDTGECRGLQLRYETR